MINQEQIAAYREMANNASENSMVTQKKKSNLDFDCLAVTSVQVYPLKECPYMGHIKGIASVVLNDQFLVRGLRVMEGENGMFVGYPIDPFFKGEEFRSVCFPMARKLRENIENCILEKYQEI